MKKILLYILGLAISIQFCLAGNSDSLQRVISGEHRSANHRARDQFRHPRETLEFFDVKEDMTVVEIWPGSVGWYTEILAPYLKDTGKLYAAHFSEQSKVPFFTQSLNKFVDKVKADPNIYGSMVITALQPPQLLDIAPVGSADRVLTFRNVHNWMKAAQASLVFNAMFKALKSGGILGVVEHRNAVNKDQDPGAKSGYVTAAAVIALAKQAGFEFISSSQINANPKDTRDYPAGVWTLPPTLRLKDLDRDKYLAIGESDRMTLKFIKP